MAKLFASVAGVALLMLPETSSFGEELKTESRMPYLHHIPLRDADGQIITLPPAFDDQGKPQEAKGNPYSTAQTCGRCHEYSAISGGWHFNASKGSVKPGRPGEPWILTDPATHTQIPLSYRGWKGTFKPSELGINDFDFLTTFARHFPGGGAGEPAQFDSKDAKMGRLQITGKMEIDCLLCHESSGHYNHETRLKAMTSQNIKWAPSIGAGLGTFGGFKQAKAFADAWRPGRTVPTNLPPMKYDRTRFDVDNNVLFHVSRRASSEACYYCHTSNSQVGDARWHSDRDFHLRAGMLCIDCHRNGIDHMVVRGYEGELKERTVTPEMIELREKLLRRDNASLSKEEAQKRASQQLNSELGMIETLSCRGCHLGTTNSAQATAQEGGRLGAPHPLHKGLPTVHFEKLSCTACHAGPFPGPEPQVVQTSLAHKLGIPGPARGENTAPVIVQPVFMPGQDGKIAPHKMVWPSYWGRLKDGKVTPIAPEEIARLDKLPAQPAEDVARDPYNTKPLAEKEIAPVLESLALDKSKGEPVFVAAGKLYRLDPSSLDTSTPAAAVTEANGKKTPVYRANVKSEEHEAARPYAWPLAHDVRPASQSLGARGCGDCHSSDAPIYFATILARGPVEPTNGISKAMWQMHTDTKVIASTFSFTFLFRPMLKYITFGSAVVVAGVLLNYGLLGLSAITGRGRSRQNPARD